MVESPPIASIGTIYCFLVWPLPETAMGIICNCHMGALQYTSRHTLRDTIIPLSRSQDLYSLVACFSHLTIDHAFLSTRIPVPAPHRIPSTNGYSLKIEPPARVAGTRYSGLLAGTRGELACTRSTNTRVISKEEESGRQQGKPLFGKASCCTGRH